MPCRSGVLVPQPGIEPAPLALEAQRLNHGTAREVLDGEQFEIRGLTWTCLSPGPGTQQALSRAHVVTGLDQLQLIKPWTCLSPGPGTQQALSRAHVVSGLDQLQLIKPAPVHSPHTGSNSHGSFFPYTRF